MLLFGGATLFPDLRREPTRFLKRAFIDDMKGMRRGDILEISCKKGRTGELWKQR